MGLEASVREARRRSELKKCQTSSWYLGGKLGYHYNPNAGQGLFAGKGLTERLHRPLMEHFLDAQEDESFLWMEMARFSHKSTIWVIKMIQDILNDVNIQLGYFHAVVSKADEVVREAGHQIQHNPYLRSLEPIGRYYDDGELKWYNALPPKSMKNFVSATKGVTQFTLEKRREFRRFPTLAGSGANTENTGAHMDKAYIDDIIGRMTVRNGKVNEITDWYESQLMPVVDGGLFRGSGTPWCDYGLYEELFKADDNWRSILIPGAMKVPDDDHPLAHIDWSVRHNKIEREDDLSICAPIYGKAECIPRIRKRLAVLKTQMKANFEPQIQVNPSPAGQKPWSAKECEHYISRKEAFSVPGIVIALSDPAPFLIGPQHEPLAARKGKEDATLEKDDWAHAILYVRALGNRRQAILIDGAFSNRWDDNEGWRTLCQLQKKWGAYYVGIEGAGAEYERYIRDHENMARRLGTYASYLKFMSTYLGKNSRFSDLAAMAKQADYMVCKETCSPEFLVKALDQKRKWRPVGKRVAMKHDDLADVISYVTDPVVWDLAPAAEEIVQVYEHLDGDDDDYFDSPVPNIEI